PGLHPRLFAMRFEGSETTSPDTCVLDAPDLVTGLAARGYHTVCIGGVGFFNKRNPLGNVLPGLFAESHWSREMGVTDPRSTEHQVALAVRRLDALPREQRVFLFINVSALHQPNRHYLPGATRDSRDSHAAALEYVDSQLPPLFDALRRRGPAFCIVCSDHGTAYGEDGYTGHRLGHPVVWTVPYAEFTLPAAP
ncbi:STM4013/SEN3800 family hydrolase, partial [Pyxidicoccus fallax]